MPSSGNKHESVVANTDGYVIGHSYGIQWVVWRKTVTMEALDVLDVLLPRLESDYADSLGSMTIVLPNVGIPTGDVMDRIRNSMQKPGVEYPGGMSVVLEGQGLWRSTWRLIGRTATSVLTRRMPVHFADSVAGACEWHGKNLTELDAGPTGESMRALLRSAGVDVPAA